MADPHNQENSPPPSAGQVTKELFCDQKKEFIEALECLYIKGNLSGRLMFADKWPEIAPKIFPAELTKFDHDGINNEEERLRRDALELQAEINHDRLLSIFEGMEKKLVVYGSLQLPALEALMKEIDRPLAEHVFAERFVNRFFPEEKKPAAAAPSSDKEESKAASGPDAVKTQEKPAETTDLHKSDDSAAGTSKPADANAGVKAESTKNHTKDHFSVPDTDKSSIGHVDHSYNTKTPDYDKPPIADLNMDGVVDENDDATSWLDVPEDEFDDVMPISTEQNATPASPQDENRAPPTMGMSAHKQAHGSDLSAEEKQAIEQSVENDPANAENPDNIPDPQQVDKDQIVNNDGNFSSPDNLSPEPTVNTQAGAPQVQEPPKESLPPTSEVPSGENFGASQNATQSRKPLLPGQEAPSSPPPPPPPPPAQQQQQQPNNPPQGMGKMGQGAQSPQAGQTPQTPTPPSSPDAAIPPKEQQNPPSDQGGRKPPLPDAGDPNASDMRKPPLPQSGQDKPVFGDMPPPPSSPENTQLSSPQSHASKAPPLPGSEQKPVFGDMPPPPSSAPPRGDGSAPANPPPAPENNVEKPRVPPLPGAPPTPGATPPNPPPQGQGQGQGQAQTQENAPRKPSLDDIDKHTGESKPRVPPLPGSEDE